MNVFDCGRKGGTLECLNALHFSLPLGNEDLCCHIYQMLIRSMAGECSVPWWIPGMERHCGGRHNIKVYICVKNCILASSVDWAINSITWMGGVSDEMHQFTTENWKRMPTEQTHCCIQMGSSLHSNRNCVEKRICTTALHTRTHA